MSDYHFYSVSLLRKKQSPLPKFIQVIVLADSKARLKPSIIDLGRRYVLFCQEEEQIHIQVLEQICQDNIAKEPDVLTFDIDYVDKEGRYQKPYFKPGLSKTQLVHQNFIGHNCLIKRTLLKPLKPFKGELKPKEIAKWLHDAMLSRTLCVKHTPVVGCHIPLHRKEAYEKIFWLNAEGPISVPQCLVSIIIPFKDKIELLKKLLSGLECTTFKNIELILISNQSEAPETFAFLDSLKKYTHISLLYIDEPYNYARLNNLGRKKAKGDILLFLNNDIEISKPDWLFEMIKQIHRPNVGIVGAKLKYPDGTIQHAGIVLGQGNWQNKKFGIAGHAYVGFHEQDFDPMRSLNLTREMEAVTGACLMMVASLFDKIGGFDEKNLPIDFNDVDLCLKCQDLGKIVICVAEAELIHLESKSRGNKRTTLQKLAFIKAVETMYKRYGTRLLHDRFYNSNLSLSKGEGYLRPIRNRNLDVPF